MQPEEKWNFYRELVSLSCPVFFWVYLRSGELAESHCPIRDADLIFSRSGCLSYALEHADQLPMCLSSPLGLIWGAAMEKREDGDRLYCIGPVLNMQLPQESLQKQLRFLVKDLSVRSRVMELIEQLPVISFNLFQHYILMLHACLGGDPVGISGIHYQRSEEIPPAKQRAASKNRDQIYRAEQRLLYHVREGDLNYQEALARASSLSLGVPVESPDPLRQALISACTFVSLCTRAAIEGGLPADSAYSLGDAYIQSLQSCKTVSEMGAANHSMYDDFVRRVHLIRQQKDCSKPVLACCEYIQGHPEEELSIELLGELTGYSGYYLSRRFRAETKERIGDYIDRVRMDRAEMLLRTSDLSIGEIAQTLHYCSRSHFSDTYRRLKGKLPRETRKEGAGG